MLCNCGLPSALHIMCCRNNPLLPCSQSNPQPEATRKKMKNAMRVVALAVPLVSTSLPASVFMYWTGELVARSCPRRGGVGLKWAALGWAGWEWGPVHTLP